MVPQSSRLDLHLITRSRWQLLDLLHDKIPELIALDAAEAQASGTAAKGSVHSATANAG
jgi:hypothetical protein